MALYLIAKTTCLSVLVATLAASGCTDESSAGASMQGNAGVTAVGGPFASAGAGGVGGGGAGATAGASAAGIGATVAIDPSAMLETCPAAPSRPQDGRWTVEGRIIETACADEFPAGAEDTRFAHVTITTSALTGRTDRDLVLVTPDGQSFRGFVQEDGAAALSGPIENYPDKPLDVDLWVVFSGYCFTANVKQVVQASSGPCDIKTHLVGKLDGAP